MAEKPKKLAPLNQGRIMRQTARDEYVAALQDGRRQRATTFGGPKNRRSDRRKAKAACRDY